MRTSGLVLVGFVLGATACKGSLAATADAATARVDAGARDTDGGGAGGVDGAAPTTDASRPTFDAGPPGTRTVTNAEVAFDGTELDLATHYGLYIQDDTADIDVVPDPLGMHGDVVYFRKPKSSGDWAHVMVRLMDKRTGYRDVAQVGAYESSYHYRQMIYVPDDPQYAVDYLNLVEDFHCEPCEANNLQLLTGYRTEDSLCLWVTFSTESSFDPRGAGRGGPTDPWETITANEHVVSIAADGTPTLPSPMPPTGALMLCRDDLPVSGILGRWVEFEMLIRPSSYDTGEIKMWIDGRPYFYDGPNAYRYNQDADENAVNVFQIGIYGPQTSVMSGTPSDWELWMTPPLLELGDDIVYVP